MKKASVFGVLLLLLVLLMAGAFTRQTYVLESMADAQALWNENELVVVVQKRKAMLQTSWLRHKVAQVSGVAYPKPRMLPEDLVVIRVRKGEIQRQDFPGVGRVGNALPHDGHLYFLRGTEAGDYPNLHLLDRGKLVRVPQGEAKEFVAGFKLESELLTQEGWHKRDLYFTDGRVSFPLEQASARRVLTLIQDRRAGVVRIELLDSQSQETKSLYELLILRHTISREKSEQDPREK